MMYVCFIKINLCDAHVDTFQTNLLTNQKKKFKKRKKISIVSNIPSMYIQKIPLNFITLHLYINMKFL